LQTGIKSLDDKFTFYKANSAERIFPLNNGDPEIMAKYGMNRIYLIKLSDDNEDMNEVVKEFNNEKEIEYCELNFTGEAASKKDESINTDVEFIPDDEMFGKQWYLRNIGQLSPSGQGSPKVGADVNMLKAWDIETGSDDVIVAILDSGIKFDHPEFSNRIWINKKEIPGNGYDDDGNGFIDDYYGWDFAYNDNMPDDGFGHGTNIASVIGANTNNSMGYAGMNLKAKLMNCKNLNTSNSGEYTWWAKSIKYAVDNGARIINMSEGGDEPSKTLATACYYAMDRGALICAAMMNRGDNNDYYPASVKGVFAVGATDTDDNRCRRFSWGGGSCWGDHISVVAPGNKIYGLDFENDYNYDVYWSGTSQSTAVVSSLASLLLSQNKNRTPDAIKRIITVTAKDRVGDSREDRAGWDPYYGFGRIDCYNALVYDLNPNRQNSIEENKSNENYNYNRDKTTDNKAYRENEEDNNNEKPARSEKGKSSQR
jgi:subtilisin family serine protease